MQLELYATEQFKSVETLLFNDQAMHVWLIIMSIYAVWAIYKEISEKMDYEEL